MSYTETGAAYYRDLIEGRIDLPPDLDSWSAASFSFAGNQCFACKVTHVDHPRRVAVGYIESNIWWKFACDTLHIPIYISDKPEEETRAYRTAIQSIVRENYRVFNLPEEGAIFKLRELLNIPNKLEGTDGELYCSGSGGPLTNESTNLQYSLTVNRSFVTNPIRFETPTAGLLVLSASCTVEYLTSKLPHLRITPCGEMSTPRYLRE